jgi:hypothetical protein
MQMRMSELFSLAQCDIFRNWTPDNGPTSPRKYILQPNPGNPGAIGHGLQKPANRINNTLFMGNLPLLIMNLLFYGTKDPSTQD